jgi:hypothetical protein
LDLWYIIPAALCVGQTAITIYPDSQKSKYGPYREAWDLLRSSLHLAVNLEPTPAP